jgi:hypothetical protein
MMISHPQPGKPRPEPAMVANWEADHEARGHCFPVGDGYWFPCRGCGVDGPYVPLGQQPCPKPYTAPEAIGKKLDRIIHLLEILCGQKP